MKLLVPPPVQGIVTGGAMWVVASSSPEWCVDFTGRKAVGAVLMGVGLTFDLIALAAFFRAKTTATPLKPDKARHLVVEGLYRYSRNPMYLGLALVLSGWGVWLGHPANLALIGVFVAYITTFQIKPEERALEQKFGAEYEDYKRRVRRWI